MYLFQSNEAGVQIHQKIEHFLNIDAFSMHFYGWISSYWIFLAIRSVTRINMEVRVWNVCVQKWKSLFYKIDCWMKPKKIAICRQYFGFDIWTLHWIQYSFFGFRWLFKWVIDWNTNTYTRTPFGHSILVWIKSNKWFNYFTMTLNLIVDCWWAQCTHAIRMYVVYRV